MARSRAMRILRTLLLSPALAAALVAGGLLAAEGPETGGREKPRKVSARADEANELFDPGPVLQLRIEIPEASLAKLREDSRAYVKGTLHEGESVLSDIGIHLKGSAGSFRPIEDRPGITLKFDQFVPARRFHGLRKLSLNNGVQDPTYLSDLIGGELFRATGIPAPRIGFARVKVNDRDLGLYMVLEAVTRDFLHRWFKDPSGNLYEGPSDVNNAEEIDVDSHSGKADRSDLKALSEAASVEDPSSRLDRLGEVLDLDRFYTFLAMETITWDWDGYAMGVNNFHLYHDPVTKRFVFFPHGIDQLFQDPGAPAVPDFTGLVARQVIRTAKGRQAYRERLVSLLPKVLDVGALHKRIIETASRIRPILSEIDPESAKAHDEAVASFIGKIAERAKSLREQLEKAEPPHRKPLEFTESGVAKLSGWDARVQMGQPEMKRASNRGPEGGPALEIVTGEKGEWCGSFRTRVVLPPGKYRFAGRVRTKGVEPLMSPEAAGEGPPSGAGLRISGKQPGQKLLGDRDWTPFEFEFEVEPGEGSEGEPPLGEVELVCELRAAQGSALFDEKSLELRRLPGEEAAGASPPAEK